MTEKTTDLIVSKLLDAANIEHYAESCPIEEINKAMVSKRGTGKKGFPEYLAISGTFGTPVLPVYQSLCPHSSFKQKAHLHQNKARQILN